MADSEILTDEQLRLEALFLGFRTRRGIHLEKFKTRYGQDLAGGKGGYSEKAHRKTVWWRSGTVFSMPTRAGMAVADSLALI